MNTKIAFAAVALAIAVAPSAFAQNNGITETLDGSYVGIVDGSPTYSYTYSGSPITVNGTFSGGPVGAGAQINGTSFAPDASVTGTDLLAPVLLTPTGAPLTAGGYGPAPLATIDVNPNTLASGNISFYGVTAGVGPNDQSATATDGIEIVNGVPEPGTVALLLTSGLGSCGLLIRRRK